MSASRANTGSGGWSKWQIAILIGAPVAVGVGYWYYKTSQAKYKSRSLDRNKSNSIESNEETDGTGCSKDAEPKDSIEDPLERAEAAKIKGNKLFKLGKYDEAIKCYSDAILLCPREKDQNLSTYYQNRAAAYEQLKNYLEVISDCGQALELNNKYIKALSRRGKAYEHMKDYPKALEDVTAVCILENFSSQSSLIMADRVLKQLGQLKAVEAMEKKISVMPSQHFLKSYFAAYTEDPIFTFENGYEEEGELQSPFLTARQNMLSSNYEKIIEDCSKEIELESPKYLIEALLLRATFHLVQGEAEEALSDLETLFKLDGLNDKVKVNGLIKMATLKVHQGQIDEALEKFQLAEATDSNNADIYHHRGAIYLLAEKTEEAAKDFDKAVTLRPNFSLAAVQKCYADYRLAFIKRDMNTLQNAMGAFKQVLDNHKECVEAYTLYAQALTDQQEFEEANNLYNKAIKIDPDNGILYVHKGLLQLQWRQDVAETVKLLQKAIEKDSKCSFAFETLGTIEVQRGDLDRAEQLFNSAISLVRTEPELAHLYSLKEAAAAQRSVAKRLNIVVPRMDT